MPTFSAAEIIKKIKVFLLSTFHMLVLGNLKPAENIGSQKSEVALWGNGRQDNF